jgi:hypothetical protein
MVFLHLKKDIQHLLGYNTEEMLIMVDRWVDGLAQFLPVCCGASAISNDIRVRNSELRVPTRWSNATSQSVPSAARVVSGIPTNRGGGREPLQVITVGPHKPYFSRTKNPKRPQN